MTPLDQPDVALIGSGIMSATLAVMLKGLAPRLRIQVFESNDHLAEESSHGWSNAGTGHAGLCELSYTPGRNADGSISIARAIGIFEQFEHSKQFWSHVVTAGIVPRAADFIHAVPHIGFVHGAENVRFLQDRHTAMEQHHFFRGIELATDPTTIAGWAPLLMAGRDHGPVAATKAESGTEVDFGALARLLLGWFEQQEGCSIARAHRVTRVRRTNNGWKLESRASASGEGRVTEARHVFVGAGGGTLPLLQSTGLPEMRGLGGFPIGGQWLVCHNPAIIARHSAKVYGMVPPASPSLGAPHLDFRRLAGKETLLFGPFASWTTKFLQKSGRATDLPYSIRPDNLPTLLNTGRRNLDLVRYLVRQGLQSNESRMEALREFYPTARAEDWQLVEAGIRVQALKRADRGAIYFGTEVICDSSGTLAALLGASPGASVSVSVVLDVIKRCFSHLLADPASRGRLTAMIPTWHLDLKATDQAALFRRISTETAAILQLKPN